MDELSAVNLDARIAHAISRTARIEAFLARFPPPDPNQAELLPPISWEQIARQLRSLAGADFERGKALRSGGAEGLGANGAAGDVLPRAPDAGLEPDRWGQAIARDGGRDGLGPAKTLAAIGLIAVLFALAAGGVLAGLDALENLLDRHGPPRPTPTLHLCFNGRTPEPSACGLQLWKRT